VGEFVTVATDEAGVATMRLDRAPVNALNRQIWGEFAEAAQQLTDDDSVRAVVIWGGPKVFAAGADIKEFEQMRFQDAFAHAGVLQEAFKAIARIPKVTIAAVNGYALGGGCELALTADFRYAADNAKLGQPEILLGLIPGAGGTQRLTRLVGVQKAKQLVYGGGMVNAEEALAIGLVDKVVPADDVYETALADARRYAAGPFALRMAKKAIDEGIEMDLDSALRLETTLFTACFGTQDGETGISSFVANGPGKAQFVGR
jgi:enoyl-CoA hydratase/carnithine racemase